jgi:starch synthase
MIVVSHPTGNQNVRQVLLAFLEVGLLECFHTTICWPSESGKDELLPTRIRTELGRRSYPEIPRRLITTTPFRESVRLLCRRLGLPEYSEFSVLKIAKVIDCAAAETIRHRRPSAVYAYEGVALQSFREARRQGSTRIYELPSGYWYYESELLREEAELQPEYADTIPKLKDTREHLEQKDEELALAEHIVVPSSHVARTLRGAEIPLGRIHVIPYGTSDAATPFFRAKTTSIKQKLRVVFFGSHTQRKGIS